MSHINPDIIRDKVAAVNAPDFVEQLIIQLSKIQGKPADDVSESILKPYASGQLSREDVSSLSELLPSSTQMTVNDYTEFLSASAGSVNKQYEAMQH